ncbi:MAG: hypothetical protein RMJ98_17570, partial [Myxococcales bacterium]|nr:hypothetical protein [Polyangiaceae bacterium]MDW8251105.1 hypothetical protein [Myxococcales bacterium]
AFMAQHPALSAELILNDRAVDPVEEGFDLVLSDGRDRADDVRRRLARDFYQALSLAEQDAS